MVGLMTLIEIMTMIEMVAEETRMFETEAEMEKETEIKEIKMIVMAEEEIKEETTEGNLIIKDKIKGKIQVRTPMDKEIVLDQIDMAEEVEMDSGSQEADLDPEVDHTQIDLGVDNLGMKKSKEVGLALKIEEVRNGVDPDPTIMIEIIGAARNIILVVRTQIRMIEYRILRIRDKTKIRITKKVRTLIEIDMIEN